MKYARGSTFGNLREVAVLDIETTSLNEFSGRIVSICILLTDLGRLSTKYPQKVTTYDTLINPMRKMPPRSVEIHGITDEMVAQYGGFEEYADEILEFIDDRPIIAHNCEFDGGFLYQEFKRFRKAKRFRSLWYCTMRRALYWMKNQNKVSSNFVSLSDACSAFGIPFDKSRHHEARTDALAALQLAGTFHVLDNRRF